MLPLTRPGRPLLVLAALLLGVLAPLGAGSAAHGAAPHAHRLAAKPFLVASSTTGTAGDVVTLTGKAPKSWAKRKAKLQASTEAEPDWTTVSKVKVPKNRQVSTTYRLADAGTSRVRLVLPRQGDKRAEKSEPVVFAVQGWFYLADLTPIATEIEGRPGSCTGGCTGFGRAAATIAGAPYARSYVMRLDSNGNRSTSVWNASYKCTRFEATLGLDDSSPTTTSRFTINTGPGDVVLASPATGVATPVSLDLTGVFRYTLAASNTGGSAGAKAALGDARMLCSGKP